jgi:hypothetical protein
VAILNCLLGPESYDALKQSVRSLGDDQAAHTIKALENFTNQPDNKLSNPSANILANEVS